MHIKKKENTEEICGKLKICIQLESQKEGEKDTKQRFPKIDNRHEVRDLIGLQTQAKKIKKKKNKKTLPNKIKHPPHKTQQRERSKKQSEKIDILLSEEH